MFFKKTRKRIRTTIEALRSAFSLLIVTIEQLRLAVAANTAKVESLAAEQRELRTTLSKIAEHSQYLATEKRNELRRQGHQS